MRTGCQASAVTSGGREGSRDCGVSHLGGRALKQLLVPSARSGTGKRGDSLSVGGPEVETDKMAAPELGRESRRDRKGGEGRAGQQSGHGARGGREPSGQAARTRGQAARGRLSPAAAEAKEQGRCFWLLKEQIGAFQVMARLPE